MHPERRSSTSELHTNGNPIDRTLDHRLLLYALTAGATLACTATTQAEVLFTPSNAVYQGPTKFSIDIDNDGVADFSFNLRQCRTFSGYGFIGCLSVAGARRFDEVAVNGFYQGVALISGATIGFRHRFTTSAPMGSALRYVGDWVHTKHRFLGVKFLINGETHFGWIGFRRVDGYRQITTTLAGWAYETDPNKPIITGDEGTAGAYTGSVKPTSLEILAAGHTAIDQRRRRATAGGNQ